MFNDESWGHLQEAQDNRSRSWMRAGAEGGVIFSPRGTLQFVPLVIEGYADQTSINHGESINFHVRSSAASYDIAVLRMGWYHGEGARLMAEAHDLPGMDHPIPLPDPETGLIEANWPVAYTLQTTPDWVTGLYLAKLTTVNNDVSYIIFIVRDDENPADILYALPVSTWQAYNNWGGKSLYDFNSVGGRAYKVSYDRPYYDFTDPQFFVGELNMIYWLEASGYDVSYATSVDLHSNPLLLANHQMFLTNYHDEYWSQEMRDHITAARDQGKDLAFFGANNVYFQIRFEASTRGVPNRVQVCYKDAELDPIRASQPERTTVRWRDEPVNQPENALLGAMFYDAFTFGVQYDYVVHNADHWVYEGTGLQDGDILPGIVGYEYDNVWDNGLTPPGLEILSNSPIPYNNSFHQAVISTAPNGGTVFNASTIYWPWALDDSRPGTDGIPIDTRVQRITANILNRMIGETPVPQPLMIPELIAPSGTISDRRPVFQWNRVPGVPLYEITIEGPSGIVHQQVVDAASRCSDAECGEWPELTLADGSYTWWVETLLTLGLSATGEGMMFQVAGATADATPTANRAASTPSQHRVVGYLPCWARAMGYTVRDIDFSVVTHVADFGGTTDVSGNLVFPHCQGVELDSAFSEAIHEGGAHIVLVLGGARSGGAFAPMAASPTARSTFVQQVANAVSTYGYDGVDIDWEVPNNELDRGNLTALVTELRNALGSQKTISLAISAWPDHGGRWVDVETLHPIVDWFGVMTYDLHGTWSGHSGHNAPIYATSVEMSLHVDPAPSMDSAREYYESRGVPRLKLLMGLPFYGVQFEGATDLGQLLTNTSGVPMEYRDIAVLVGNGWTRYWDATAQVPYLRGTGFISYDDPQAIQAKCDYVRTHNLGGVIIWALHQDVPGTRPLLNAAMACR